MSQESLGIGPGDPRAWVRVANAILGRITSGELEPASRLPAQASLAHDHEVSLDTVGRAFRELAYMGLIRRYPGCGYYVLGEAEPPR